MDIDAIDRELGVTLATGRSLNRLPVSIYCYEMTVVNFGIFPMADLH
jgi:hypothetical protein